MSASLIAGRVRGPKMRHGRALSSFYTGFAARELGQFRAAAEHTLDVNYAGIWHKVPELSESIEETADLFELSFVARQGARLANTLVIEDEPEYWESRIKVRVTSLHMPFHALSAWMLRAAKNLVCFCHLQASPPKGCMAAHASSRTML